MFVDSHCHLDFPELAADLPAVLEAMAANQVTHALCISVNLPAMPSVVKLAADHAQLYASVGVHPDVEDTPEPDADELVRLAAQPKVVAIGETGLDYYRLKGDLSWQRTRFRTHIRAARVCRKPLVIHTRAAAEDTLAIMREEGAGDVGGVMHCFTESWDVAAGALELGFYISFSGIVTFKNAQALKDVARRVPLAAHAHRDRLALPCARAVSRQDQSAGLRALRCRRNCAFARRRRRRNCGDDFRQFFSPVRGGP